MALDDLRRRLDADGFVVVPGLVPRDLCERLATAMAERLGLDPGQPQTWAAHVVELNLVPMWGHQAQWDIRQLPELHEVMTGVHGTERLWVSIDTCNFTPPWHPGVPEAREIHWDVDPRAPRRGQLQGLVALEDTPERAGGFRCAPSWRDAPERWPERWRREPWGEVWDIEPPDDDVVEVPMGRGDLLLWDSALPHGTVRNATDRPRLAAYVSMFPAGPPEEAAERVAEFEASRSPAKYRWRPGHDEVEPWPPARLTALGERLLGRVAW